MNEYILSIIASWPQPNYIDPVTRGWDFLAANLVLLGFVVLIVSLRIYTRLFISRYFGLDDVLMCTATFSTCIFNACSMVIGLQYHFDRHVWDVPVENFGPGRAFSLAVQVSFAFSTTLTKVSALVFFSRLNGPKRNWICRIAMAVCVMQGVIFSFMDIFQCKPIRAFWDFTVEDRKCLNEGLHLLVWSVANTITDLIVVLLPMPVLWNMKIPQKERIMVRMLFGIGGIVCAAGIGRIIYTVTVAKHLDETWEAYPIWLVNSVELDLGIICTSAPALKPLITQYFPKVFEEFPSNLEREKSQTRLRILAGSGEWTDGSSTRRNEIERQKFDEYIASMDTQSRMQGWRGV